MQISASIYSNAQKNLSQVAEDLVKHAIDMAHVDCNDEEKVFEDIHWLNQNTEIPVDLHIIAAHPEKYFDLISQSKIKTLSLQYEDMVDKQILFDERLKSTSLGLAITTDTPISVFAEYAHVCSFILLMSTTPGQSGGVFDPKNFKKIHDFKKQFPQHKIQVDGGVNGEVSFILRNLNVDSIVSGSYLMRADNMANALIQLKYKPSDSHFYVKDIMLPKIDCPCILQNEDLLKALEVVDAYKFGFVNVVDEKNTLLGILSNADIRKAFITHLKNESKAKDVSFYMNANPITIHEDATVTEMLLKIKQLHFPILFLPVINSKQEITGVITFNNLIKGEL
jgi:ribulose-phosphate 3-epimerase